MFIWNSPHLLFKCPPDDPYIPFLGGEGRPLFPSAGVTVGRQCARRSVSDASKSLAIGDLQEALKLRLSSGPNTGSAPQKSPPAPRIYCECSGATHAGVPSGKLWIFKLFIFLMIALRYRAVKMITRTKEECFRKQKSKTQKGGCVFKRKIDGDEKLGMHTGLKKKHTINYLC